MARFSARTEPFTWSGGRKLGDGHYVACFTMRLDGRIRDVRHVALRRRGGRFQRWHDFRQPVDCGTFKVLKLSSAVFGGTTAAPLRIAVRLAKPARALRIEARTGDRLIRRWTIRDPRAAQTYSLRLPASAVARGSTVSVRATAQTGATRRDGRLLVRRV